MGRRENLGLTASFGFQLGNSGKASGVRLYLEPVSEVLGLQALPAGQQRGMGSPLVQSQAFLLLGCLPLQLNTKHLKGSTCAGGKVRIIHQPWCAVHTRR